MLMKMLAERIIKELKKLINENIIVVDSNGYIIASTDHVRVGQFHEGALIALTQKKKIIISEEDQKHLQGVKAGINLPVFFQNEVIGVIGITGDPDVVSPFGEIIRKMTELLVSESYFSEQLDLQLRSLEAFVFDWLQFREWDQSFLNRAQLLNINLHSKRQAVIIQLPDSHPIVHRDVWHSLFKWNDKKNDIIIRWGNDRLLMLIETNDHETRNTVKKRIMQIEKLVTDHLKVPVSIGVGQKVTPKDLQQSFIHAERAVKASVGKEGIVFDDDLKLEMILDDVRKETKNTFLDRTIGPIISDPTLMTTISELFKQNHSLKNTAEALHIHINTLHYRLKKIKEFTDLDPNKTNDLLMIFLALMLLDESTK